MDHLPNYEGRGVIVLGFQKVPPPQLTMKVKMGSQDLLHKKLNKTKTNYEVASWAKIRVFSKSTPPQLTMTPLPS